MFLFGVVDGVEKAKKRLIKGRYFLPFALQKMKEGVVMIRIEQWEDRYAEYLCKVGIVMCVDEMLECIRIAFKHRKVLLEKDKDKAEKMIDELQKLYIQREE